MTLKEWKNMTTISAKVPVRTTVLGYTEKTKRYYSFYNYAQTIGWNQKLYEEAPNNILDCEIKRVYIWDHAIQIDVIQYVPEECLDNEEELA